MSDTEQQTDEPSTAYRRALLLLEQQGQAEYDKACMALSGGALGISMTFLTEVVLKQGVKGGLWLIIAWVSWALSLCATLYSFYTSAAAMRRALKQVDEEKIYEQNPGGWLDRVTTILNAAAGILFFLGVVAICVFVYSNIQ